ncbi:hypothetical protein ACRWXB_26475, partial [Escherichia coli]
FTPCDTLVDMADKGASFYQVEPVATTDNKPQAEKQPNVVEELPVEAAADEVIITQATESDSDDENTDEQQDDKKS